MTKDRSFKLRLDDADRMRLDAVAAHYSAPAATAIRMHIKEKYDTIRMQSAASDEIERDLAAPAENVAAPKKLREAVARRRQADDLRVRILALSGHTPPPYPLAESVAQFSGVRSD